MKRLEIYLVELSNRNKSEVRILKKIMSWHIRNIRLILQVQWMTDNRSVGAAFVFLEIETER